MHSRGQLALTAGSVQYLPLCLSFLIHEQPTSLFFLPTRNVKESTLEHGVVEGAELGPGEVAQIGLQAATQASLALTLSELSHEQRIVGF